MKTILRFTTIGLVALGTLFLILAGCSTDSPTEPEQPPLPGGGVTGRWAIAIDSSANTMEAGGDSIVFAATISNRDTATPPPDGATVIVSTTLGLIGDPTTGSSALVLQTFGGGVVFEVFSGVDEGTATVEVAFQNAMARRDVMITRDTIELTAVRARTVGDTVVLRLITFSDQTYPKMEELLNEQVEEAGGIENVNGFVIDLRNNPGGLLTQAIQVSDAFLEEGDDVMVDLFSVEDVAGA